MSSITNAVVGSVPYLNCKPLIHWFTHTPEGQASGIQVVEAVPSRLARMLESGEVATALVSSIELFRVPGLTYVPNIAIAADGPVESVRMLSRVPIPEIRTVALDSSSLTSVVLLRILLEDRHGLTPEYTTLPPNLDNMLQNADAALLIGDLGYRQYGPDYQVFDLGAEWKAWTGLPFIYAAWIGHPENHTPELCATLTHSKEWGTARIEEVAKAEASNHGESPERALHYLRDIMRYDLGPDGEAALELFGRKARERKLIEG